MGRLSGRIAEETLERTLDLGVDREYMIELPDSYGIELGKIHGIGARASQEDAFGISADMEEDFPKKGILLVLADGMGGMRDGGKASTATVVSCLQYFEHCDMSGNAKEWLHEMALAANKNTLEALGDAAGMGGATLVAVHVTRGGISWVSVGDSRLYLFRNGRLNQLNEEHNYWTELRQMVADGEISEEDAANHPQKRALTSYIGMQELKKIDCAQQTLSLQSGDWLLLLTDGVFGTLTENEIAAELMYSAARAAKHIELMILERRKPDQDNFTGILVKVRSCE